jgi:hypothetical protein
MRSLLTYLRWRLRSPSPALGQTANEVIDEVLGDVRRRLEQAPPEKRERLLMLSAIGLVAYVKSRTPRRDWEEIEWGIMKAADAVAGMLVE